MDAWQKWGGQTLYMGHALKLIEYERNYGKDVLIAQIEKAGTANQKETLDLRFLSKFLEGNAKDAAKSAEKRIGDYGGVDAPPI